MGLKYSEELQMEWVISSVLGAEKQVSREIASFLEDIRPEEPRLHDMLTAVTEACLNAFEHGNRFDPASVVKVRLEVVPSAYKFYVADQGSGLPGLPEENPLQAKWEAEMPRGWGLFLIRNLCDQVEVGERLDGIHQIKMTFYRDG